MEEAFSLLYPICMNLTDDSTTWADGVPQLSEIISSMGDVELQEIKDFVVFPLRFILFRLRDRPASPRRNYLLEQALNCLEPLLLRVRVSKSLFLQQLLGELCVVLGCPTETSNVSEAVKLAVVKSIKALLRSASKDSLKSIFDVSYLPSLGHAVSTLLALAEREAARALRLHALECLLLLFQSEGDRATSAHDPATSTGPRASVCRLLGYYGDLQLLTCEILEELHDSEQHRVAATMVLVEVIVGAAGCGLSYVLWDRHEARLSEGEIKQLSKALVEEFTSPQHWQLDVYQEMGHLKCDDNAWNGRRLMAIAAKPAEHLGSVGHFGPALHTVAWRLRVQIEGLAAFAGVLGPQFQPLLQSCLFPLLEKAGESSLAISHTARLALRAIARALRLPSPRHLVSDNVDYLLDAVSTGLRFGGTGAEGQAALRVLRATLQRSNRRSLPILRHVALDMLSALDVHHSTRATLYCSAILALAQALERWFAAPTDASEASHNPSTSCSDQSISPLLSSPIDDANGCMEDRSTVPVSAKDVERFFLEYHRNRRLAQGKPESGDPSAVTEVEGEVQDVATTMAGIGEVPEVSDSGSEGPSALPLHVCLGKELLERSTHLLPHHNLTVRLQMLEVAGCCVRVLRSHKEDLLPAANQLWFALVPRLLADDSCVVLAAFKLLGILAQSCGDFLRHRVISEVLPRLSSSLLNQAMISAREGALYSYTQASRLQYAALKSIGPMCLALGLVAEDIEKVAAAALPYLSNRQPKHLQESAIGLFQDLVKLEPDLVWLMLNDLYCPETLEIPHKSLNVPKFAGSTRLQEYAENTLHLLALLDVQMLP
uniref:TELO2-interacting protein 1 homolog isoform X4 n=1 Tax=Myxine glutinosa TaxID=7769 RepID=UPI00358FC976